MNKVLYFELGKQLHTGHGIDMTFAKNAIDKLTHTNECINVFRALLDIIPGTSREVVDLAKVTNLPAPTVRVCVSELNQVGLIETEWWHSMTDEQQNQYSDQLSSLEIDAFSSRKEGEH